ncbi:type II toxin-antitoxin system RelE/ParE family toxin [Streptomyces sp. NPDC005566]|uniref:type II toxin-antitoxin system RelE/ParE family toxin n=1 Tax=Streptomyces sp. NPDC005566 TaxID=3156886 RepID=UPI0033BA4F75
MSWTDSDAGQGGSSHDHVSATQEAGPALGRPTVGAIEDSRYRNMRELRSRNGSTVSIRMLFVFDPVRRAVFLVAGNKASGRPGTRRRSKKPTPSTWLTLKL